MGCGCWTRSRLRMGSWLLSRLSWRTSRLRRCCLIFIRASCSCFILGCLVLGGLGLSCFILGCLVLDSLGLSCFILGCLALGGLGLSCFILGSLVLGGLGCGRVILSCLVCRSLIRCSGLFGRYYSLTAKLAGLRSCSDGRFALVHGRQEGVVGTGSPLMLGLQRGCRRVLPACRCLFGCRRASGNSTGAAVVADPVHGGIVDNRRVVNVVNVGDVHVVHRTVVVKLPVLPTSALIAGTAIAKAVIDAAVEADLLTPVAAIPGERAAAPTPVTGSPEQTNGGRLDPRTRHPEVAFTSISPIAGSPQITVVGGHRLHVHRQCRRSDRNRHLELRERGGRYGQYQECQR